MNWTINQSSILDQILSTDTVVVLYDPNFSDIEKMCITWNESATFNVYFIDSETGEITCEDVFTVYGVDNIQRARALAEEHRDEHKVH